MADEAPSENEEQLRFVANAVPALLGYLDASARYLWVNESYRRWFGYAPEAVRGRHVSEVLGAKAWAQLRPYVERVLEGEAVTFENRIHYKNGGARDIRASYVPHLDSRGRVRGFVVLSHDISEIRSAERALRRSELELREADQRKDEFLAMLSHELRNPLAPILSAIEVIEHAPPDDEALRSAYQAIIARQVQHMKRLLDDLLDVSRVSQGKIELRKQRVELATLLLQAIEVSRPLMTEKRHQLALTLAQVPMPLDADPTRVVQVFANLINNAAKYTDAGGHIALFSAVEDGEAVVAVRDDGKGMSAELLARAFDLFVQETRSFDRAQGGLGIGLTLVRTLVKMHGGSVQASSDGAGRGSAFVVRLPLAPAAPAEVRPAAPPANADTGVPLRVLVVDDNVDAAYAMKHVLKLSGHRVVLAHDGPTALAAAAAEPPELVLLDIGLPGMDGYTVAARLREAGHDRAALVAITGYGQEEDLRRSTEAGFDHHLIKPVDGAMLRKLIAGMSGRLARDRV
jgi:PAS domain S-box-containing protein